MTKPSGREDKKWEKVTQRVGGKAGDLAPSPRSNHKAVERLPSWAAGRPAMLEEVELAAG